ncbi:MAG: ferrous iron transport protein A [Acholeplasmataceae bacterium]|nr:ferrous iron transport protein A [Acholeplasmataceae bacterium]
MKNIKEKFGTGDQTVLSKLRKGQKAKVVFLNTIDKALRRRLLDMGITEGVQIKIKKIAPLGDPVDIELRGYELCLRKKDLAMIDVEVIS